MKPRGIFEDKNSGRMAKLASGHDFDFTAVTPLEGSMRLRGRMLMQRQPGVCESHRRNGFS